MNIEIVCYPTFGGSGVLATELGKALADKGHNIHFITYQQPVRLSGFHANIFYHEVQTNRRTEFLAASVRASQPSSSLGRNSRYRLHLNMDKHRLLELPSSCLPRPDSRPAVWHLAAAHGWSSYQYTVLVLISLLSGKVPSVVFFLGHQWMYGIERSFSSAGTSPSVILLLAGWRNSYLSPSLCSESCRG